MGKLITFILGIVAVVGLCYLLSYLQEIREDPSKRKEVYSESITEMIDKMFRK